LNNYYLHLSANGFQEIRPACDAVTGITQAEEATCNPPCDRRAIREVPDGAFIRHGSLSAVLTTISARTVSAR